MAYELDYQTYVDDCKTIITIGFDMAEPDYDVGFSGGVDDWCIISTGSRYWKDKKNINRWYRKIAKNSKLYDGIMQACCEHAADCNDYGDYRDFDAYH